MKDFTNQPKSNFTIVTTHTTVEKILELLKDVQYNEAMLFLKMAQNRLTSKNGMTINEQVSNTAKKYPKIKEASNSYKK